MSNGQALTNLIIILVVFYFAAFFVAAEFAIVSVRKSALESALEAGEGNKRKLKLALNMVSNMNEYLSTTQVGVTTTGIILGWLGADTLAVDRSAWLHAAEQDEHRGNQCRFGRRYFDVP